MEPRIKIIKISNGVYQITNNMGRKIVDTNFNGWGGDLRGPEFELIKKLLDSEDLEIKHTPFNIDTIVDDETAQDWCRVLYYKDYNEKDFLRAMRSFSLKISEITNLGKNGTMKKLITIVAIILAFSGLNAQTPAPSKQIWTTSNTIEQEGTVCVKSVDNLFNIYAVLLIEIDKEQQLNELVFYEVFNESYLFSLDACIEYDYKPWCDYKLYLSGSGNGYYYYYDVILAH